MEVIKKISVWYLKIGVISFHQRFVQKATAFANNIFLL